MELKILLQGQIPSAVYCHKVLSDRLKRGVSDERSRITGF